MQAGNVYVANRIVFKDCFTRYI